MYSNRLQFISILILITINKTTGYNRLIRVDGINPTCFTWPRCRTFTVTGAVINVDKSLPYMGSNMCCISLDLKNENELLEMGQKPKFLGRISNTTELEGDDFITFYDGHADNLKLVKNLTSNDQNKYDTIYFKTTQLTVIIYKDRDFKSIYDIILSSYLPGNSSYCKLSNYHRCSNSSQNICIDEELTCDKYEHCPNGSDEEPCESHHETNLSYDKFTVTVVSVLLIAFIIFSIGLLCYCKSNKRFSKLLDAIFGGQNETAHVYLVDDMDQKLNDDLIRRNSKKQFV